MKNNFDLYLDLGLEIFKKHNYLFMHFEEGCYKYEIALSICEKEKMKKVGIVTTKNMMEHVKSLTKKFEGKFEIVFFEHKKIKDFKEKLDILIVDYAHKISKIKLNKNTVNIQSIRNKSNSCIMMSSSPLAGADSYTQLYRPFSNSIFTNISIDNFVDSNFTTKEVKTKKCTFSTYEVEDAEQLTSRVAPALLKCSLSDMFPDFKSRKVEKINIKMNSETKNMIAELYDKNTIIIKLAISEEQQEQKAKQLSSGTIKIDQSEYLFDYSKADYIRNHFQDKKCVIVCAYKAEEMLITKYLNCTTDLSDFKRGKRNIFVVNYKTLCDGLDISKADVVVFYNPTVDERSFTHISQLIFLNDPTNCKIVALCNEDGIDLHHLKKVEDKIIENNKYWNMDLPQCNSATEIDEIDQSSISDIKYSLF